MKELLTLLLISIIQTVGFAQIPNGGFEDWEAMQNFEQPIFWETNQDSNYVRFVKDTMSIEGDYSLKVIPSAWTTWADCNSYSKTGVHLQSSIGENKSLTFFVKSVPDPTDQNQSESVFLEVKGKLFVGGNFESDYNWETFERIDDFTRVQIPILNTNVDSLTIEIIGGATNGGTDICNYRSFSWIDGFEITETEIINSSNNLSRQENGISLYPNPSNGHLEISQNENKISNYFLYSIDGKLLEYGSLVDSKINLNNKYTGLFLIRLTNDNKSNDFSQVIKLE